MDWYSSQQQQQGTSKQSQERKSVAEFESIYEDVFTSHYDFWMPLLEDMEQDYWHQVELQQTIFSGKTFQKNPKTRKWEPQHLELMQDMLVRVTPLPDDIVSYEYCRINQCFLKKINYSESSFQSFKFGFRLQIGRNKAEFFTETNENFNKWFNIFVQNIYQRYNYLRRYTLLPKFSKKYKLVSKIKIPEPFQASTTYKTVKIPDNVPYQVRVIEKHQLSDSQRALLLKEIKLLRRLDHPNICKIQEVYEDANFLYLVFTNYAGKEIRYRVQELLGASERVLAEFFYKILYAIHHCHQKGVIHSLKRDLNFDNIFIRQQAQVTDVCLANFTVGELCETKCKNTAKKIGSPGFLAPEMFRAKTYDAKVDIFSIGIIFYFLVYGRMAFGNENQEEVLRNNEQCEIDFKLKTRVSTSALDLLSLMLRKEPSKRINSFQAMNHHWFINMKIKDQVTKNQLPQQQQKQSQQAQNLSTILEKSEIMDISATSMQNILPQLPRQKKRLQTRMMSTELGFLDEEFVCDSVSDKLTILHQQCPYKVPSRRRHFSSTNSERVINNKSTSQTPSIILKSSCDSTNLNLIANK